MTDRLSLRIVWDTSVDINIKYLSIIQYIFIKGIIHLSTGNFSLVTFRDSVFHPCLAWN